MNSSTDSISYVPPRVIDVGDLVDLTAQGQGGQNKPFDCADGQSGTIGNASPCGS